MSKTKIKLRKHLNADALLPDFQGFEGYKVLNIMKTHAVSLYVDYGRGIL
ncbi:MAG: hypothetical protein EMLJLAPB_00433 [Candidatus Argoarchaeum ethanivorans]|uniref:Uncharacterized protein n=1 Tax=Candidatus Argoarchaeum ethanivorans TaxID=2608793 RepID=A0A811TE93_9EURY|nr:MAG: hypothetical protein EMLJLAPB_00433 [Candidatus Argoarchaeum ethanivorans]